MVSLSSLASRGKESRCKFYYEVLAHDERARDCCIGVNSIVKRGDDVFFDCKVYTYGPQYPKGYSNPKAMRVNCKRKRTYSGLSSLFCQWKDGALWSSSEIEHGRRGKTVSFWNNEQASNACSQTNTGQSGNVERPSGNFSATRR